MMTGRVVMIAARKGDTVGDVSVGVKSVASVWTRSITSTSKM
jgi:hypothetical protein